MRASRCNNNLIVHQRFGSNRPNGLSPELDVAVSGTSVEQSLRLAVPSRALRFASVRMFPDLRVAGWKRFPYSDKAKAASECSAARLAH